MSDITLVLESVGRGESQATEELFPLVYEELRRLTISAANTLTLDASLFSSAAGMSIASGSKDVNIGSGLTLAGHQAWNVGSGRTLTVSGTLTTTGAWVDFSSFAGTAAGSSLTTLPNGIYGPWATYGTGTSLRYATESGGVVSAYYLGGTAAATAANVTDTTGVLTTRS